MFADSVVGLRAKLAKSKEVTELTCLNLFCASSCLAALATGCQPARGHLAGCALGWAGERLCEKTRELAAATRGARQYYIYREPRSLSQLMISFLHK